MGRVHEQTQNVATTQLLSPWPPPTLPLPLPVFSEAEKITFD